MTTSYVEHFRAVTGCSPYDYQLEVARLLFAGRNVLVRAPTGAGKTWAVLAPFLSSEWQVAPTRLIYALPLRTLAQGVYREAREAAARMGHPIDAVCENDREVVSPFVTLQTGEQPEDPFFDRGRIIVTTYDQLISGLLCSPYSLSDRLHNVNAASIVGTLVVFDEFHLMPPDKAFLTAIAGLQTFGPLCQSVWMTATATKPLAGVLADALDVATVPDGELEAQRMMAALPSIKDVSRTLTWEGGSLTPEAVIRCHQSRSIALTNTVGRAQALFEELRQKLAGRSDITTILLHSRFFKQDRQRKEEALRDLFGKGSPKSAILVATQVIEAGIDISCEHLHTELCPMNALVQRAGRCARYPGEEGTVHVYDLPQENGWLPYGSPQEPDPSIEATRELLKEARRVPLNPLLAEQWVERIHRRADELTVKSGVKERRNALFDVIHRNAIDRDPCGVGYLVRGDNSESVRVVVCSEPPESPGRRESIAMSRWSLAPLIPQFAGSAWYWSGDETQPWKTLTSRNELAGTYAIALSPAVASYDEMFGLRLGQAGIKESPRREEPPRPGYAPYREESWTNHARMVRCAAESRLRREGFPVSLTPSGFERLYGLKAEHIERAAQACAILHDLGKLQVPWQEWAIAWQSSRDRSYRFTEPLAHTDFDPESQDDRKRQHELRARPPHAAAGGYYACSMLQKILDGIPEHCLNCVISACVAAIVAHHGAFIPKTIGLDLGISALSPGWVQVVEALGVAPDGEVAAYLLRERDKRRYMSDVLGLTTSRDALETWWPLVSYLIRTLRLSDQRATSEWSCSG